ncbi:hypothetical protein [Arthrobacter sp. NPDC092385]|uniref:hypothetical protein n=1 Tax=Arthrobacter sp. NPDC092385 TaxID=3363943 RepID=UPI0038086E29
MFLDLSLAAATTPSGDPTLKPGLDPSSVTPGTLGFLATLFVVVLVIFLIRDMVKRIRRVRYTAEVEQARAQREGAATGSDPDATDLQRPARGPDDAGRGMPGGKHGPDNR